MHWSDWKPYCGWLRSAGLCLVCFDVGFGPVQRLCALICFQYVSAACGLAVRQVRLARPQAASAVLGTSLMSVSLKFNFTNMQDAAMEMRGQGQEKNVVKLLSKQLAMCKGAIEHNATVAAVEVRMPNSFRNTMKTFLSAMPLQKLSTHIPHLLQTS